MKHNQPQKSGLRVAFRVDASTQMGGGHVMRCLTLAGCLAEAGADVAFIAASITNPLRHLVGNAGFRLAELAPAKGSEQATGDWDRAIWNEEVQREDAARTAAQLDGGCDWLVVDHYGLESPWEMGVRGSARRVAVIDDLANRPHDCELLIDQTYGRDSADYGPLSGKSTELLIGARYALLRPEFARARPHALARHFAKKPVERILISLGMTDVGGLTEVAARAALSRSDAAIDILLSSAAPTLNSIRRLAKAEPRLALHVDAPDACGLMAAADLAVGAAGTTSWERCCLGLPAIVVAIADNQRMIAAKLAAADAIYLIEASNAAAIAEAIARLSGDEAGRVHLARASAEICDGEGATRVASRMLD